MTLQLTEAEIAGLCEYVQWHGPAHVEGCPGDDTCECTAKPLNDAVNAICRKAFDAQLAVVAGTPGVDDFAITAAMIRWGGGFVQQLGALWRAADADNRQRLREAFPEYWTKYTAMAVAEPGDVHEG